MPRMNPTREPVPADGKIKHLEFIQGVINRLASDSFRLKGWSVVLVSALFVLSAREGRLELVSTAFVPVFVFWGLDGYFLWQERLFRALYDHVRVLAEDQSRLLDGRPRRRDRPRTNLDRGNLLPNPAFLLRRIGRRRLSDDGHWLIKETICDGPSAGTHRNAIELLRAGFRRGMMSRQIRRGWPRNVWAVDEDGVVYEAQLSNAETGEYHGYPMKQGDGFAAFIAAEWERREA